MSIKRITPPCVHLNKHGEPVLFIYESTLFPDTCDTSERLMEVTTHYDGRSSMCESWFSLCDRFDDFIHDNNHYQVFRL